MQRNDSLASISARLGGDERRWPELFAANEGARHPDGHVLKDPRKARRGSGPWRRDIDYREVCRGTMQLVEAQRQIARHGRFMFAFARLEYESVAQLRGSMLTD